MRISELSRRTGVPTATIKYYLREGLLPPGRPTAATQAQYDGTHVQRLRLIRALAEVGGLSLASIRRVLDAVDDKSLHVHQLLGTAHYALGPTVTAPTDDPEWTAVRDEVDAFIAELGWQVTPGAPARDLLTQALLALRRLGMPTPVDDLRPYADAARSLATRELARLPDDVGQRDAGRRDAVVAETVAVTTLYEPVLLALRRLAQEHESALRFREDLCTEEDRAQ